MLFLPLGKYLFIFIYIYIYLGAAKNLGLMRVCEGFIVTFPSFYCDFSLVLL